MGKFFNIKIVPKNLDEIKLNLGMFNNKQKQIMQLLLNESLYLKDKKGYNAILETLKKDRKKYLDKIQDMLN